MQPQRRQAEGQKHPGPGARRPKFWSKLMCIGQDMEVSERQSHLPGGKLLFSALTSYKHLYTIPQNASCNPNSRCAGKIFRTGAPVSLRGSKVSFMSHLPTVFLRHHLHHFSCC